MAVDYLGYLRSVENPLDRFAQGQQQGAQIKAIKAQEQAANAAAQQIAAKQQAQQRQQQAISAFIQQPKKTAEDYSNMMMQYPALAEGFKKSYDTMEEGQQKTMQRDAVSIYAAIENGQIDIAESILDERIRKAEQRGDADGAQSSKIIKQTMKVNPEAAKATAGFFLAHALGGEGMADVMSKFGTENRNREMHPAELRIKQKEVVNAGLDGGLKQETINKIMAQTRKLGVEAAKIEMDMEIARQSPGGMTDKDKIKAESELRKEVGLKLKANRQARQSRDQMYSIFDRLSSGAEMGIADVMGVVSVFKSMDPTSTVTATETGQIVGAEGLWGTMAGIINKSTNEGKFTPGARKSLIRIADKIFNPILKEAKDIEDTYRGIADRNGLDVNNVLVDDFTEGEGGREFPEITGKMVEGGAAQQRSLEIGDDYYTALARAESGGNPNAKSATSSASGLYQFTDATWKGVVDKYGAETGISIADKNDPAAQNVMVRKLTNENKTYLEKQGLKPNAGDLYIAHFMGAPRATRMLRLKKSPSPAVRYFPKEAKANRSIFYKKDGQERTVAEVYALLKGKVQ